MKLLQVSGVNGLKPEMRKCGGTIKNWGGISNKLKAIEKVRNLKKNIQLTMKIRLRFIFMKMFL